MPHVGVFGTCPHGDVPPLCCRMLDAEILIDVQDSLIQRVETPEGNVLVLLNEGYILYETVPLPQDVEAVVFADFWRLLLLVNARNILLQ
jgi:hypothetical protein